MKLLADWLYLPLLMQMKATTKEYKTVIEIYIKRRLKGFKEEKTQIKFIFQHWVIQDLLSCSKIEMKSLWFCWITKKERYLAVPSKRTRHTSLRTYFQSSTSRNPNISCTKTSSVDFSKNSKGTQLSSIQPQLMNLPFLNNESFNFLVNHPISSKFQFSY